MKTLLVAALVLIPCGWALADPDTNAPAATPPELTGLTPEQQKQAEPILAAEQKKKTEIEDNKSLSPQQKEVQITDLHRHTLIQIKALKSSAPAQP